MVHPLAEHALRDNAEHDRQQHRLCRIDQNNSTNDTGEQAEASSQTAPG